MMGIIFISPEIIAFVAVIIFCVIYVTIKTKNNEKKGIDSPQKARIAQIIGNIQTNDTLTPLYAFYELVNYQGNLKTTKYWYYAVGAAEERLYIVPIKVNGDNIVTDEPGIIEKKDLYRIDGAVGKEDNPYLTYLEFYYQKEDKEPAARFSVLSSNTKDDAYHPVNIQQLEEHKKFCRIMNRWFEEVNTAHGIKPNGKPLKK